MKVKELIEKMSRLNPEHQVRLIADHGQELMTCNGMYVGYIQEDVFMAVEIPPDELANYNEDGYIEVVVLEAY